LALKAVHAKEPIDLIRCKELLAQLKLLIYASPISCAPTSGNEAARQKGLTIARDALQLGALIAVKCEDAPDFERHVQQLFPYYQDFIEDIPKSGDEPMILGLYLLHLLAESRIGDVHLTLQWIPEEYRQHKFIRHPVQLNQFLTDGNYNKVICSANDVPSPLYTFFVRRLIKTVRQEVANCLESAYKEVDATHAANLLMMDGGVKALEEFTRDRNARIGCLNVSESKSLLWEIKGDRLLFKQVAADVHGIPSIELIQKFIAYATELERIV